MVLNRVVDPSIAGKRGYPAPDFHLLTYVDFGKSPKIVFGVEKDVAVTVAIGSRKFS
jgi:hypothetical protein